MDILVATNNDHKKRELSRIFVGHRVLVPQDVGLQFEHVETGKTFLENAIGKAQALRRLVGVGNPVVLADDSGLSVDALDGRPGILSARYGSPDGGTTELPAVERNERLLEELEGISERQAHFVCCMVVLMEEDRLIAAQEQWDGEIAESPSRGKGGFGYDPIFLLPELGCTAADLAEEQKNQLSHRGKAAARLSQLLDQMPGPHQG